jgi:hypothetical protein
VKQAGFAHRETQRLERPPVHFNELNESTLFAVRFDLKRLAALVSLALREVMAWSTDAG